MATNTSELIGFGVALMVSPGNHDLKMGQITESLLANIPKNAASQGSILHDLHAFLQTVPHDNIAPGRIAAYIFISVLTIFAVVLRFFSRFYRSQFIRADDWMALVSLVFCLLTAAGFIIFSTVGHDGSHFWDITYMQFVQWAKTRIAAEFLFKFTNILVKSTFLIFYYGLSPNRCFRRCVVALFIFTLLSALLALLATLLQCKPINWWDNVVTAECLGVDKFAMYAVCGTLSILTDIMILALPLPFVWKLQLRRKEKIVLTMIFALGGFICVVAVVRLISLNQWLDMADMIYGNLTFVWTLVELDIGLIIACVPALRALFMPSKSIRIPQGSGSKSGEISSLFHNRQRTYKLELNRPETDLEAGTRGKKEDTVKIADLTAAYETSRCDHQSHLTEGNDII